MTDYTLDGMTAQPIERRRIYREAVNCAGKVLRINEKLAWTLIPGDHPYAS